MNYFVWSGLHSFIANLFIGAFVLLRNPKEKANRTFAFFSLLVSGWSVGSWLENILPDRGLALWVLRVNYLFGVWVPPVYLHFVHTLLPSTSHPKKYFLKIGYVISSLLSPCVFTPYFIPRLRLMSSTSYYISEPGPLYYLFFVFFAIFMVEILRFTFVELKNKNNMIRSTFYYLALANCLAIFAGFEYFSRVFNLFKNPPIDDYVLVLYVFVLAFAIARHGLFDFDTLVNLIQREKLATIGLLSASINHEIRNPLFVARGSLESYLKNLEDGVYGSDGLQEVSRKAASTAISQIARAGEIMDKLTHFAKPYQGSTEDERVLLREVLENVSQLTGAHLRSNKISLLIDVQDDAVVVGSRRQLEEIFFNLIVNACQAMKGGGELTVRSEQRNGSVQVEIEDQGPGIPQDQLSKIFQPFYTTKDSGTGLGLYITKQLVEKNRGRITVKSQPNQGTRFTLDFPTRDR